MIGFRWILLFLCIFGNSLVHAKKGAPYEKYGSSKSAIYACNLYISSVGIFCEPSTDYYATYACICQNDNARATFAGCLNVKNQITKDVVDDINKMGATYNLSCTVQDYKDSLQNYTKYAKLPSEIENYNISVPVNVPIKLNDSTTALYFRAYDQFLGNYDNSLYYGLALTEYFALVFVLAIIANWSKVLFPRIVGKFTGPISNTYRKYISLPAFIRRKKTQEQVFFKVFDFLVPSRLESLILFGFLALTIAVSGANIKYIENDPVFATKGQAIARYIADRTGITATLNMPLLILFAGRNNFLQWLTRWDFATFICYHRWVARVIFLLVVVHASCFTHLYLLRGYYAAEMKEAFLVWGTIATVAGGIIMVQGMLFLRRAWYEIFLLVHIIMAALFIGGAWIHVEELGYVWIVYSVVAVWCFDRAVRVGRLFWFGFPKSEVILLADETLKVIVPKPKYWKSVPGGHAFIHFLRPSCFWQSHPFTFTDSKVRGDNIVLYCKVKGGVTHGLYQYLSTHPGKTTKIRVALEGPYGEATPAKSYDTANFVAGGNGIPGIYSEVVDLARRSRENSKQHLKLTWIVREYKSLYWFYEELIALKDTKIETTIYVTKPNLFNCIEEFNYRLPIITNEPRSSDAEINEIKDEERKELGLEFKTTDIKYNEEKKHFGSSDDESEDQADLQIRVVNQIKAELSHIQFKEGRPDMEELVKQEVEESNGSVAFVTCGHPVMVDDLRYSVVQNLDNPDGKRLDFFEQLQVWA